MTDLNLSRIDMHRITDLLDDAILANPTGFNKQLAEEYRDQLRDAAGLREPTDRSARIVDIEGVIWVRHLEQYWPLGLKGEPMAYDDLIDVRGPLELAAR